MDHSLKVKEPTTEEKIKTVQSIESVALNITTALAGFIGCVGIFMYIVTKSGVMLIDGVFSLVNFMAALFAIIISRKSVRQASNSSPFGSASLENIFLMFRSLLLISYLVYTFIGAIAALILKEQSPAIVGVFGFGPITTLVSYSLLSVLVATIITINNRRLNKTIGNVSEILKLETKASVVDGVLSVGAVAAVVGTMLISDDATGIMAYIKMYGDQLIVIALVLILIKEPVQQLLGEVSRLSGKRVDFTLEDKVAINALNVLNKDLAEEGFEGDFTLNDVYAVKRGKQLDVFLTVSFSGARTIEELDAIRDEIRIELEEDMPNSDVDVLWTKQKIHSLD